MTVEGFTVLRAFKTPRAKFMEIAAAPDDMFGWENDDYLAALSKGPEALAQANEDYYAQSKYKPQDNEDDNGDNSPPTSYFE